jgi:hypothetical protein
MNINRHYLKTKNKVIIKFKNQLKAIMTLLKVILNVGKNNYDKKFFKMNN